MARADQVGTLTNTATVASGVPDTNAANDTATARTTVVAPPAAAVAAQTAAPKRASLRVSKRGPRAARAGQIVTYRITVTNRSRTAARRVVLRDTLASGMSLASRPKGGKVGNARVTWNLGTLRARASRTITVRVRFEKNTRGTRCNSASATASNAATSRGRACTRVAAVAGAAQPAVTG